MDWVEEFGGRNIYVACANELIAEIDPFGTQCYRIGSYYEYIGLTAWHVDYSVKNRGWDFLMNFADVFAVRWLSAVVGIIGFVPSELITDHWSRTADKYLIEQIKCDCERGIRINRIFIRTEIQRKTRWHFEYGGSEYETEELMI